MTASLHTLCFWFSLWILRVSFLNVLQPFKKSEFPAILGNVLQNLQVIRLLSILRQNQKAVNPETVWTFFSAAKATFGYSRTGVITVATRFEFWSPKTKFVPSQPF
jgi:hypothetical protein